MKRICLSILVFALLFQVEASAQAIKGFYNTSYKARNNGTFDRNTGLFSLGLGVPNKVRDDYWGGGGSALPTFQLKYEHGIIDEIGIGGTLGMNHAWYNWNGDYTDRIFGLQFSALGYYHFNKIIPVRNLDVYAGMGIGVRSAFYRWEEPGWEEDGNDTDVFFTAAVGARYYFARKVGVFLEFTEDRMSFVYAGITFRL